MAITRFETYAATSLASAGFCFLSGSIASMLRPDVLTDGMQAGADLAHGAGFRVRAWLRVRMFKADLEDFGPVLIVARSVSRLADRIEDVLGVKVISLTEVPLDTKLEAGSQVARSKWLDRAKERQGDVHAAVVTQEGPRTCDQCEHLTATSACSVAHISGVTKPHTHAPRRCLGFVPEFPGDDARTGRDLWPELNALT